MMLFVMKNMPGPPGLIMQKLNALLHKEPIASIAYGLFWSTFFLLVAPLAVIFLLIQLLVNLGLWISRKNNAGAYHPREVPDMELAVVVTGCDTGFGKEIASVAAKDGFIVFAGCLKVESLKTFNDEPRIHPFLLDVTSDQSTARAVREFEGWLYEHDDDTDKSKYVHFRRNSDDGYSKRKLKRKRVLHAVINNAGIGAGGEVDWIELSTFQKSMDGK
jgi:hypothetical protein